MTDEPRKKAKAKAATAKDPAKDPSKDPNDGSGEDPNQGDGDNQDSGDRQRPTFGQRLRGAFLSATKNVVVPVAAFYAPPDDDCQDPGGQQDRGDQYDQGTRDELTDAELAVLQGAAFKLARELGTLAAREDPELANYPPLDPKGQGDVSILHAVALTRAFRRLVSDQPSQQQDAGVIDFQAPPLADGGQLNRALLSQRGTRYRQQVGQQAPVVAMQAVQTAQGQPVYMAMPVFGASADYQAPAGIPGTREKSTAAAAAGWCQCGSQPCQCGGAPRKSTKERLCACLCEALCDFLRCLSGSLCVDGRLHIFDQDDGDDGDDANQKEPRSPQLQALLDCTEQMLCSLLQCLPDALCPPREQCLPQPCAPDLLCDFAVEEMAR